MCLRERHSEVVESKVVRNCWDGCYPYEFFVGKSCLFPRRALLLVVYRVVGPGFD